MLARSFGCARVVFNDALQVRHDARVAGEKISDTEVHKPVVTGAKKTPEREWLAQVGLRGTGASVSGRPGGRTATSSTPCPGNGRAARWGHPGFGPIRTTGSRSG
ncbi:helix-turn-helix domain-containing protein [Rhodococcus marinonascens]|uniref:helix-turn-helix domain-containing protein n=1 Tax=Rhodococcus marinonascens TaxID=38311 RepID=UPI001FE4FFF5|nr:helix-turn-helix domain-containing protein [Rhodococcus marinonascens]